MATKDDTDLSYIGLKELKEPCIFGTNSLTK